MATQDKYDRQVRIWGVHGQELLRTATILLLGCDAVGVETVKNLVLPGVGTIIIVDNKLVSQADVENNFFTPLSSLNQPRGKVVLELLLEMNPDVSGQWYETLDAVPHNTKITLIIANETVLADPKSNYIQLQTYGFIGRLRIYSPLCEIIEVKPMGFKYDLRINNPFPALEDFCSQIDFSGDPDMVAHIPYVVILRKALKNFQAKYNKDPTTFHEKNSLFKQEVNLLSEAIPLEYRANFDEALQNLQQAFPVEDWKQSLQEIDVNLQNTQFTQLCAALRQFVEKHGNPPLQRAFPDMKCFTQTYLTLKNNIYGAKWKQDLEEFRQILLQNGSQCSDEQIALFIENINNLRQIRYRSLEDELKIPLKVEDFETDGYLWYCVLRTADEFQRVFGRGPNLEDVETMKQLSLKEAQLIGIDEVSEDYIHELCRYQGGRIQTTAAILGGMASQEAVKLITHQFVPINNTLIFNGLKGEAAIYQF